MEAKRVCHPLPPVYDQDSRVLFLGTMPSPKSRETGFYYAHPHTTRRVKSFTGNILIMNRQGQKRSQIISAV